MNSSEPGPSLVLLAHGTGDAAGRRTLGHLLLRLRARLPGVEVRLAYAGVARPQLADLLPRMGARDTRSGEHAERGAGPSASPVVVVPAFLAAGFHVRSDVPGQLADLGAVAGDVLLTEPLGPDPALVEVMLARLRAAGADPDVDTVVLAAAGSTDPVAQDDLRRASAELARRVGRDVPVGYIAGGAPKVADVVREARVPGRDVVLATWLLAPGAFHRWLADAGADVVAEPLGDHPGVVDVIVARYRSALTGRVRAAAGAS